MSSDATFPILRVSPWDGSMSDGMRAYSAQTLFNRSSGTWVSIASTPSVMRSSSHRHHREPDNGEFVFIISNRPDDEAERDEESHPIDGMLVAILEDEVGHDAPEEWQRRMREFRDGLAQGDIPITPGTMQIDGTDVEFQFVNLGQYSAAWASLDTVTIELWSRGVSLDGLSLVSQAT